AEPARSPAGTRPERSATRATRRPVTRSPRRPPPAGAIGRDGPERGSPDIAERLQPFDRLRVEILLGDGSAARQVHRHDRLKMVPEAFEIGSPRGQQTVAFARVRR